MQHPDGKQFYIGSTGRTKREIELTMRRGYGVAQRTVGEGRAPQKAQWREGTRCGKRRLFNFEHRLPYTTGY